MTEAVNKRTAVSSLPEDAFVELFAQVFGLDKVQLLSYDHPVEDIYGASRYIDYALNTIDAKVAFEIDGLTWHHPEAITVEKFEDDLLRQNSLIHQGWRVFRWTDRELMSEPERLKEQLALFLESISDLVSFEDFLPTQRGEAFELRPHQEEALESLDRMRSEGKTIALLTHAQGAGKTVAVTVKMSPNFSAVRESRRDRCRAACRAANAKNIFKTFAPGNFRCCVPATYLMKGGTVPKSKC